MNKIFSNNENSDNKNKFSLFDDKEEDSNNDQANKLENEEKKFEHPNPELEFKINKIMDELTEKYLVNREYIESKIDNWINAILNEIKERLNKEKEYKFISYCFISKRPIHFWLGSKNIKNVMKDGIIKKRYEYKNFICILSIGYYNIKIIKTKNIYIKDFQKDILFEIEKIQSNILDGRNYDSKTNKIYKDYILIDIRKLLKKKFKNYRTHNLCIFNKENYEIHLKYKIINDKDENLILHVKNHFNNLIVNTLSIVFY